MKQIGDRCHIDIIESIASSPPKFPEYVCKPIFVPDDYVVTSIGNTVSVINTSTEMYVGLLFLLAVIILGITIVELLNNKLEWFIDPLCKLVVKRYDFVMERNRLLSMNGHP